jgi:uncharacterized protein YutE (UPF0331/DUF86 family)
VLIDIDRIEEYLNDITTEVFDVKSILNKPDEQVLQDRHLIKSLKYSTIVIAESIGSLFQHILAKKHSVAVRGYTEAFVKAKEYRIVSPELIERLLPFARFRNMLVHQYWRVKDQLFLKNIREGIQDFETFVKKINELYINQPPDS